MLCFSLVMVTVLYHHISDNLLSAAHHYHNFHILITQNMYYVVQFVLYKRGVKHFKPQQNYVHVNVTHMYVSHSVIQTRTLQYGYHLI